MTVRLLVERTSISYASLCRLSVCLFRMQFLCVLWFIKFDGRSKKKVYTQIRSSHSLVVNTKKKKASFFVCSWDLFSIQIEHQKEERKKKHVRRREEEKKSYIYIYIFFVRRIILAVINQRCVVQLTIVIYLVKVSCVHRRLQALCDNFCEKKKKRRICSRKKKLIIIRTIYIPLTLVSS